MINKCVVVLANPMSKTISRLSIEVSSVLRHLIDWFELYAILKLDFYLNASFGQVDAEGQVLSHAHVWVLCLLKGLLQSLQLGHCERRPTAPLFLLVSVTGLEKKLC